MKKILIIDDDTTFQKTITSKLKELAFDVVSAFDGEEGLSKIMSDKPDLVLLDIKMPKLDGLELLKRLRANKDAPQMPILITSNLEAVDNISEGIALGAKGYIIKSDETLETIVKDVQEVFNAKP